jgi:hypothetical protein
LANAPAKAIIINVNLLILLKMAIKTEILVTILISNGVANVNENY